MKANGKTYNMVVEAVDELQNGVPNVKFITHSKQFATEYLLNMVTEELKKRGEPFKRIRRDELEVGIHGQQIRFVSVQERGAVEKSPGFFEYMDHAVHEHFQWHNAEASGRAAQGPFAGPDGYTQNSEKS